jgi:K+-sensing histidine kinase KdpD
VHDTGIGIPPDKLSKVFEAFHRLDSTRADGLGLGLFVVRRAVDLLGHSVEVRSDVGRGSSFAILAKVVEAGGEREPAESFAIPCRADDILPAEIFYLPHTVAETINHP